MPTLLPRTDGVCLLYAGRVHSLTGEPGGGKTWIALHLIADTLTAGGTAMLIDYEDTPASAVSRLRTLGVDQPPALVLAAVDGGAVAALSEGRPLRPYVTALLVRFVS